MDEKKINKGYLQILRMKWIYEGMSGCNVFIITNLFTNMAFYKTFKPLQGLKR